MPHIRINKPCEDCGCMMMQVDHFRRFCPDCRRARRRAQWRMYSRRVYSKALRQAAEPAQPRGMSVDEVARRAAQEGISYGQYSVRHGLYGRTGGADEQPKV